MKNNLIKTAAAVALSLAMALSMSACGHQHTWADATCTSPQTCTECGKTEGEALGHSWVDASCAAPKTCSVCKQTEGETLPHTWEDASCAAPKTCSVCGETEGEALPHTWREANYQQPATCAVCGETEGDVLTPDFVTHGIRLTELGETHDITLTCYSNKSKNTVAHVTYTGLQIFESSEDFPAKEGYEYRQATFTVLCDDENAWNYGVGGWRDCQEDYYDIKLHDDFSVHEDEMSTYKLTFNGEEMEEYVVDANSAWGDWVDKTVTATAAVTVLVPVGYDGYVHGIFNNNVEWPEGGYIYDIYEPDTFFMFRFA